MTFYDIPYDELGFQDDEWADMTCGDKRLIRDFILNGYNETRTVIYNEYQDDSKLRKLIHKYSLYSRPKVHINYTSINFY